MRKPGSSSFKALESGSQLPMGTEVDASSGSIALTSALPGGDVQTGRFGGGRFVIRQGRAGYVDLYLRGPVCQRSKAKHSLTVASAARRKPKRRLWGADHGGGSRTHGKNSHATVRGTRWVVGDTCAGTLTRVSSGQVVVRDTVRGKSIVLDARERYLARPRHERHRWRRPMRSVYKAVSVTLALRSAAGVRDRHRDPGDGGPRRARARDPEGTLRRPRPAATERRGGGLRRRGHGVRRPPAHRGRSRARFTPARIDRLHAAGAKLIAYDVQFTEPTQAARGHGAVRLDRPGRRCDSARPGARRQRSHERPRRRREPRRG